MACEAELEYDAVGQKWVATNNPSERPLVRPANGRTAVSRLTDTWCNTAGGGGEEDRH